RATQARPGAVDEADKEERKGELNDLAERVGRLLQRVGSTSTGESEEVEQGDDRRKRHRENESAPGHGSEGATFGHESHVGGPATDERASLPSARHERSPSRLISPR